MRLRKKRAAALLLDQHKQLTKADVDFFLGKSRKWICTNPLDDVFLSLLVLAIHDKALIDAEIMALMAKRLIASEQQAGGPYGADTPEDREANAAIAQLFMILGAPLPSVNKYLRLKKNKEPSPLFKHLLRHPTNILQKQRSQGETKLRDNTPTVKYIDKELSALHEPVRTTALHVWKNMKHAYSYSEIVAFTKDFGHSLTVSVDTKLYDTLTPANVYFWIASIIYDDFIDSEAVIEQLPLANIVYRKSFMLYDDALFGGADSYFTLMDTANAWELKHCRFRVDDTTMYVETPPDYQDFMILAHRAIGHILGPLAIVRSQKVSEAIEKNIYDGLCHYLIARQLDDDLHDWVDDATKGHISPIVSLLLGGASITHGAHSIGDIIPILRNYFFEEGLRKGCDLVLYHARLARELLLQSGMLNAEKSFFAYIATVEETARKAVKQVEDNHIFIEKYKNKTT